MPFFITPDKKTKKSYVTAVTTHALRIPRCLLNAVEQREQLFVRENRGGGQDINLENWYSGRPV